MLSRIMLLPLLLPFYLLGVIVRVVTFFFGWLFEHIGWAFGLGMDG